jgi:low temperature requirement protein LtrA
LVDDRTPRGAFQVLLIFGVMWWMFGGYVWLTNAVGIALSATVQLVALLALLLAVIVVHPRRGMVRPLTDGVRVPSADAQRDT